MLFLVKNKKILSKMLEASSSKVNIRIIHLTLQKEISEWTFRKCIGVTLQENWQKSGIDKILCGCTEDRMLHVDRKNQRFPLD